MDLDLALTLLATIILLGFWIWTLMDVLKSEFQGNGKIVWLLVIFFLSVLGSILYLFIGRKQRILRND